MRRVGTHERRALGGSRLLPPGPALASASGVVTPSTILGANLLQWIEGPLGVTQASGVISAVADQSGNAYNYTGAGASQPGYEIGGYNGQDSWFFDGSNDCLLSTAGAFATALLGGNDTPFTMWIAGQWLALAAGGGYMWSCGNSGSTLPHSGLLTLSASSTRRVEKRDTVSAQKNVDSTGQDLLRHVWTLTTSADGTQLQVKEDNAIVAAFAANNFDQLTVTFDKDAIGCLGRNTNTLFSTMRMAGRVSRAGVASAGEDLAMYNYMAALNTASQSKPMFKIAGDSLSLPDKWQVDVAAQFPNATIVNRAHGGTVLHGADGLARQFNEITSNYDAVRPENAASQHYGSNDIALDHRTALQLRTDATTWATAEGVNGTEKLIACTIHQRGGATPIAGADEVERVAYNSDMRLNYLSYGYHYLLDKDLIITELPTDLSVFTADGIHLNDTGDSYLANGRNGQLGMIAILQAIGF